MNLAKQQDTKSVFRNQSIFVHQQWNIGSKMREKIPFTVSTRKNKVPMNKPNQGGERPVPRKLHNAEERS